MKIEMDGRDLTRRICALVLAFVICGLAPAHAQGVTAAPGTARGDAAPKDAFAAERKVLLGGKASASEIAIVVAKLVRSDEAKAHALLRDTLRAVPERASVATGHEVLRALVRELGVDVDARLRESERPRVDKRLSLYVAAVRPLVELCVRRPALVAKQEDGFARDCTAYVARLPATMRRKALAELWREPEKPIARMAVLFAGRSEDPGFAPELARLLSETGLLRAVRSALGELTWRAKPFQDQADFDAWWKQHEGLSFGELMRRAASASRELGREHERELDAVRGELRQKLLERSQQLVRAMVADPLPKWKAIGELFKDPELASLRAPLFDELANGLIARGAPGEKIRPTLSELAALRDGLETGFEQAPAAERGALLAAWTMCAKWSGATASKRAVDRLLGYLAARGGPVSVERLFELLRQFPEDRVRSQVLGALERPENRDALAAGLSCLRKLGPSASGPVVERTLALLENVIRDAKRGQGDRERALEVLGELANVDDRALRRIEELAVGSADKALLADSIRVTALQWVVLQSATRLQSLSNGKLLEHAKGQLLFFFACLEDGSARLRQEGAKALASFPGETANFTKAQVEDYARKIVARVGRALVTEASLGCARQEIEVLARQAARARVAPSGLSHLVAALATWTRNEVQRRTLLVPLRSSFRQHLASLAKSEGVAAGILMQHATRFGEARMYYEQALILRAPAFASLEAAIASGSDDVDAKAREHAAKRAGFVLALSELRTEGTTGAEIVGGDLHKLAASAAEGLKLLSAERPEASIFLAESLLEAEDAQAAESVLAAWRSKFAKAATPALRRRAALVAARAMIAIGKPREAVTLLAGDKRAVARLVRVEAMLHAGAAEDALRELRPMLDGNQLVAQQREEARNHYLASLIKLKKIDEAERVSAKWRALPAGRVRARRELLLRQLQTERRKENATKRPSSPVKR